MSAEIIEGEVVELQPERALVVQQPGQSLVAVANDPADMVKVAARLATVLRDIVDRQRLYTVIQGKSYPQVEAWQTIGRLDNVVAREARPPIRHDDGCYEAFAELIRLSDGMVIGSASAICGSPDDEPWGGTPAKNGKPAKGPRPENARRSMAATRAISRAFRGQYAWIMALAGYEPTPAEEMPREDEPRREVPRDDGSLVGRVEVGDKASSDFLVRQTPDGSRLGFRLRGDHGGILVETTGALAEQLVGLRESVVGQTVSVWGSLGERSFTPKSGKEVVYQVLAAERMRVPGLGDLPADDPPPPEAESLPLFSPEEQAAIYDAIEAA